MEKPAKVKKMGRPKLCPDQEVALATGQAKMSFKQMRLARKLGGGNFSQGIREALEHVAKDMDFINACVIKNTKPKE